MSPKGIAQPGAGAPRKAPEHRRSETIRLHLTPAEKRAIVAKWGLWPGRMCRKIVMNAVEER